MTIDDKWARRISRAVDAAGHETFYGALADVLCIGVEVDYVIAFVFRLANIPQVVHHTLRGRKLRAELDAYVNGLYVLDPLYNSIQRGQSSGVYAIRELMPDNFTTSEFFRRFWKPLGFVDRVDVIVRLPHHGGHLVLYLERTETKRKFSKREIAQLRIIEPLIGALARNHWRIGSRPYNQDENEKWTVPTLDTFGSRDLTKREREVAQLILSGHSSESIARNLSISPNTVWVHRKHVYSKLRVSSQAELFHLFLKGIS